MALNEKIARLRSDVVVLTRYDLKPLVSYTPSIFMCGICLRVPNCPTYLLFKVQRTVLKAGFEERVRLVSPLFKHYIA